MQTKKRNHTNTISFYLYYKITKTQFNQLIKTTGVIVKDKKFVITTETNSNSVNHESDFTIKHVINEINQ